MVERKDRYIGRLYSDIEKVVSDLGIFWSTGELREFVGGSIEPYWALVERREGPQGEAARPPWAGPNWTRMGRLPLLSFSLSLSFLLLLLGIGKGGNLLLLGVGIPPLGVPLEARPPPPPLLYIRGMGAPHRHTS